MASVDSNYAEVFVDGGSGAAASRSSEGVVYSDVIVGGGASTLASSSQQYQQISSSSHQQQITSSSSQQQIVGSSGQDAIAVSNGSGLTALESQLAERIVGYGYQSFAIEDDSAETESVQAGKKESKFGQLRRSFGKGKKKRLPTGFAANFASGRDILMKGWLHKQDSGGFHLWKRRWFVLRGNELYYYKSPKDNGALGLVKLTSGQRIAPTDDNISKKYSFKITQEGAKSYILAADNKETLTNWMNAVSLSALGIPPETITQSLQELKPSATLGRSTSTISNGRSTLRSVGGTGSVSTQSTLVRSAQTARVQPAASQVQSTTAFVVPANSVQVVSEQVAVNGPTVNAAAVISSNASAAVTANAGAFAGAETHVKLLSKSLQSCDVSEGSDDEEEESSEEESDDEDGSEDESMVSSEIEQINFANKKPPPAPKAKAKVEDDDDKEDMGRRKMQLLQSANTNLFGNLMQETNITENVTINKTENVNINRNEDLNLNLKEKVDINLNSNEGLKSFFGSGQHLTGSADIKPLAVKPPTYNQVGHDAPLSSLSSAGLPHVSSSASSGGPPSDIPAPPIAVANGNVDAAQVSGRAGQVFGNLADWQNRTLQRPSSSNRHRIASAGDPLAEKRPFDRNRTQSADDYLDEPGAFHRTQSMRSLKMWYDTQRTTGRSRGATPEPVPHGRYHVQQPVIMDLDKNERLYIQPSTTTLVRSKSRQAHQTLTKSSGALVPVKPQAQRPATAMGGSMALVSRDQVMMQKNYQMQMFLRQQYVAQQQQQQQQQHALLMQQQMQQQQAMLLQQQIQREEELLRKKKEKEKKEKEKMRQKRERELIEQQQIEEQLKRSTTIINESVHVSNDPKVKRVFVRRAKKEPKPPPPPPVEKIEFSMQTIADSGCQTDIVEEPPPPPPTFSETLIVRNQTPSPAPVRFVETVTISPPTPEESDEESEEEWEVLVSSDQNSWNMVACETLPSRVIRSASLSNLEYFIKDELSAETQKVLEEAEEVRFSEEVIQTIMTKTVEDTTTTNTTKTISMHSEANSSAVDGVFIGDVEEGEIILPAITIGPSSAVIAKGDGDVGNAKTTTVTKVTTDPYQDTQVESHSTDEGEGKTMSTRFHQGHATIVDDQVAYDYASSDEANAEFQRQLLLMQSEFGQAGDVSSDSGMSYQTPAGTNVSVEQKITTSKTGVQVSIGDGNQHQLQQQMLLQQLQQPAQAPEISITDMDTNQVLQASSDGFTNAYEEPQLHVSGTETGGVDISLGDFRIAAIKRRVSTVPDDFSLLTPEKEASASQTKTVKGILKKSRPSSSSSEHDVSQFTEQFMDTVARLNEGKLTAQRTERRASVCLEDGTLPDPVIKSSTIVVQANSPATERKASASTEAAAVDISLEAPSTKHYSTHLHKTISSASTPELTVEVEASASKKPTTILTTTLDNNRSRSSSPFIVESKKISTQSIPISSNLTVQGSQLTSLGQVVQGSESGSASAQFVSESQGNTEAELERIMSEMNERKFSKSNACLIGAVLPPLDQDLEKVREKFVSTVGKGSVSTENAGALGRKLIAVKRETEAKQTTLTYFTRRLKEEEGVLEMISQGADTPYVLGRKQTQTTNVTQLREKVAGIEQSIEDGKAKIAALEIEWEKVKPEGDVDLLASLSRSASTSRAELRGGASSENVAGSGAASGGGGEGDAVSVSGGVASASSSGSIQVEGASSSVSIDTMESKAVAVEKEAMRSVLSTISSQFTARSQDFDKLRREEEEIKALLASRMRGIDLEIDQIEAEQQRLEIEQTLEDLEADNITAGGATQEVETA